MNFQPPSPDIFTDETAWREHWFRHVRIKRQKRRCSRCLYDEEVPGIVFDMAGLCQYCHLHDRMDQEYPCGARGEEILGRMVDDIKRAGNGKPFDVVIGVSGGCDSSFMVSRAIELGLRPLAAHFDNTWNSGIATENIHKVMGKLGVQLYTHVVDNEVYNDIYRSFLLAGVPDVEAPTDIALATTLYLAGQKYGIRYQFEGHSFRTEGVSPLGWLYMDGRYIESVVRQHGHYSEHRLRTYPNLTLTRFLKFTVGLRVKKIRPLYWMDYDKEATKTMLKERFDWRWYGGHHLENRFTAFYHSYFLPRRFGIDQRPNAFSAMIRSAQMTREEGLKLLEEPPLIDLEIVEIVKKRLNFPDQEWVKVMTLPLRTYKDYPTYKQTFERLRPLFYLLYKMDLVPKSFYVKYTAKSAATLR